MSWARAAPMSDTSWHPPGPGWPHPASPKTQQSKSQPPGQTRWGDSWEDANTFLGDPGPGVKELPASGGATSSLSRDTAAFV